MLTLLMYLQRNVMIVVDQLNSTYWLIRLIQFVQNSSKNATQSDIDSKVFELKMTLMERENITSTEFLHVRDVLYSAKKDVMDKSGHVNN